MSDVMALMLFVALPPTILGLVIAYISDVRFRWKFPFVYRSKYEISLSNHGPERNNMVLWCRTKARGPWMIEGENFPTLTLWNDEDFLLYRLTFGGGAK